MTVQRLAAKAQAQRQRLRCRRGTVLLVGHVQQADAPTREESEDDGCQVLPTDGGESDDADAALVVPGKEKDVAMLGTGEGAIALPKAFPNADLIRMQARDPDCLLYMPLVNKPEGAVASSPGRSSPSLSVRRGNDVRTSGRHRPSGSLHRRRKDRTEAPTSTHSALSRPPPHRAARATCFSSEPYTRTTSFTTGDISGRLRPSRA